MRTSRTSTRQHTSLVLFGKILLLVLLVNALIFVLGGVLHELGHALTGILAGCTDIRIVLFDFSTGDTFTAMHCQRTEQQLVAAGSFFLILPVSGLFLILRGFALRFAGWILLGVHLIGSAADISIFLSSSFAIYSAAAAGLFFIIYGEDRLITGLLQDHSPPEPTYTSINVR